MSFPEIVATYGYPVVVVGAMVEGETVLIAAGYLAHRHHFELWKVVACAAAGGIVGDQSFFFLGRHYGERLLARLPRGMRARVSTARAAVQQHPLRVLLSMRFIYGMRIILPILCGTSTMSVSRYVRYNVATAMVWATLITGVGFFFGAAAEAVIKDIEHYEGVVLVVLVVAVIAIHLGSKWIRNRVAPRAHEP